MSESKGRLTLQEALALAATAGDVFVKTGLL